VKLTLARQKNQ